MQKLRTASRAELDPAKKASEFVKDVIVIEGPECRKAFFRRSLGDKLKETWSIELQTTNISSTPIPIIRMGKAS